MVVRWGAGLVPAIVGVCSMTARLLKVGPGNTSSHAWLEGANGADAEPMDCEVLYQSRSGRNGLVQINDRRVSTVRPCHQIRTWWRWPGTSVTLQVGDLASDGRHIWAICAENTIAGCRVGDSDAFRALQRDATASSRKVFEYEYAEYTFNWYGASPMPERRAVQPVAEAAGWLRLPDHELSATGHPRFEVWHSPDGPRFVRLLGGWHKYVSQPIAENPAYWLEIECRLAEIGHKVGLSHDLAIVVNNGGRFQVWRLPEGGLQAWLDGENAKKTAEIPYAPTHDEIEQLVHRGVCDD